MEQKLQELRAEYERGLHQMTLLDQRRQDLQHTLLRISGAIQVLEELIAQEAAAAPSSAHEKTLRAVGL